MKKKFLLTSTILISILAGGIATQSMLLEDQLQATVFSYNNDEVVVDPSLDPVEGVSQTDIDANLSLNVGASGDLKNGSYQWGDYNSEEKSITISVPFSSQKDDDNKFINSSVKYWVDTFNGTGEYTVYPTLGEITFNAASSYPSFDNKFAVLYDVDNEILYKGYVGFIKDGVFTPLSLAGNSSSFIGADRGLVDMEINGSSDFGALSFKFYGLEPNTKINYSSIYIADSYQGVGVENKPYDESTEWSDVALVSDVDYIPFAEAGSLPGVEVGASSYQDPVISSSIKVDSTTETTANISFDFYDWSSGVFGTGDEPLYVPFTPSTTSAKFISDESVDIIIKGVTTSGYDANGVNHVVYEIELGQEATLTNVKMELTGDDGAHKNLYSVADSITTTFGDVIDHSTSEFKYDSGMVTGHIDWIEDTVFTKDLINKVDFTIDGKSTTELGYDLHIDGVNDNFVIINPDANHIDGFTNLSLEIETIKGSVIESDLLNRANSNAYPTTILDSIAKVEVNESQTEADIYFDLVDTDLISQSITSELSDEGVHIGYGMDTPLVEDWALDSNLNPDHSDMTSYGEFTINNIREESGQAVFEIIDLMPGNDYTGLFFYTDESFYTYDSTEFSTSLIDPVIANSGMMTPTIDSGSLSSVEVSFDIHNTEHYNAIKPEDVIFTHDGGTEFVDVEQSTDAPVVDNGDGTSTLSYVINDVETGPYDDIYVSLAREDGSGYTTPVHILDEIAATGTDPIISASFEQDFTLSTTDKAVVNFKMFTNSVGGSVYDTLTTESTIEYLDIDGNVIGNTTITSISPNGDGTSSVQSTTTGLNPNTTYQVADIHTISNEGNNFNDDANSPSGGALEIITEGNTPFVANSGVVSNIQTDSFDLEFEYTSNPGDYSFTSNEDLKFIYNGTTEFANWQVSMISNSGGKMQVNISGLSAGATYNDLSVKLIDSLTDPYSSEVVKLVVDDVSTNTVNPIVADSFKQDFDATTETSATFTVGINKGAAYTPVDTSTQFRVHSGSTDLGTVTPDSIGLNTVTLTVNGLDPKSQLSDIQVSIDGETWVTSEGFELLTKGNNPIKEGSGLLLEDEVSSDTASLMFDVQTGDDYYEVTNDNVVVGYDISESTTVNFINSKVESITDNGDGTSTVSVTLKGLSPNTTYSNISATLDGVDPFELEYISLFADGSNSFTTDKENPIIDDSFEQVVTDGKLTTDSATFTFTYLGGEDYYPPTPDSWTFGYVDESGVEQTFTDVVVSDVDSGGGAIHDVTVTVSSLNPKTVYDKVWISNPGVNSGDHISAKQYGTSRAFSIYTVGLNPIIENSANVVEGSITDRSFEVSFQINTSSEYDVLDYERMEFYLGETEHKFATSEFINEEDNGDGTSQLTYEINGLSSGVEYSYISVVPWTAEDAKGNSSYQLEERVIYNDPTNPIATLGANPIIDGTIEFNNIAGTEGTEAEASFYFFDVDSKDGESDTSGYSTIDLSLTQFGYESSNPYEEDDNSKGRFGGMFEVSDEPYDGSDTNYKLEEVGSGLVKATYHLVGLESNMQYNNVFVRASISEEVQLADMYAINDNASFISKPELIGAQPLTFWDVVLLTFLPIALVLFLIWLVLFLIKLYKKNIALGMYLDNSETLAAGEIVYDVVHVKHIKLLWKAHEDSLILIAGGVEIPVAFKRAHSNMTGYKMYINMPTDDPIALTAIFNSIRYNTFYIASTEDENEHHYHINILEDKKIHKIQTKLAKLSEKASEQAKQELLDSLLERKEYSHEDSESEMRLIATINRTKSTHDTLRYQVLFPEEHPLIESYDPESPKQKFYYIYNGKSYELEHKFVSQIGHMFEFDFINLEPETIYTGLSVSLDGGKTILPSPALYGVTKDMDGHNIKKTPAKLAKPKKGAKASKIWTFEEAEDFIGEEAANRTLSIILKKHYEDINPGIKLNPDNALVEVKALFYDKWLNAQNKKPTTAKKTTSTAKKTSTSTKKKTTGTKK